MDTDDLWMEEVGAGVFAIDTGYQRPRFDAAYLVVDQGRAAFVDTGTAHGVPRLLAALDRAGVAREDVEWVIPTHVHLDHAGGAGVLLAQLPSARLLVHPRGAPHLVNPVVLWAGASAVFGAAEMERSYGEMRPVPAARVVESRDGMSVMCGQRPLVLAHTPGHADHHHCIWDEATRCWFTGDTFGLSYREFDTAMGPWIMPTTTPVQFDPDALRNSIAALLARSPAGMYLTHWSRVGDVPRLARHLLALLEGMVAVGERHAGSPRDERHAAYKRELAALLRESLLAHGCDPAFVDGDALALLALDIELNAQGLGVWADKRRKSRG